MPTLVELGGAFQSTPLPTGLEFQRLLSGFIQIHLNTLDGDDLDNISFSGDAGEDRMDATFGINDTDFLSLEFTYIKPAGLLEASAAEIKSRLDRNLNCHSLVDELIDYLKERGAFSNIQMDGTIVSAVWCSASENISIVIFIETDTKKFEEDLHRFTPLFLLGREILTKSIKVD